MPNNMKCFKDQFQKLDVFEQNETNKRFCIWLYNYTYKDWFTQWIIIIHVQPNNDWFIAFFIMQCNASLNYLQHCSFRQLIVFAILNISFDDVCNWNHYRY